MTSNRLTLDECGRRRLLGSIPAGRYSLEYTDTTHLKDDIWVGLGHIDVRPHPIHVDTDESEQFYTFTPEISGMPADAKPNDTRIVKDVLSLALGRLGLITPAITPSLRAELLKLDDQDGVVIVPDTNALHNGALHWLLRALRHPSVWILPVVASLTTIQNRDAILKSNVNKQTWSNLSPSLRSRGLVNGALGLLQRNRGRCQVVEIDPSLLRYQKMGSSKGADPDQSDVLEDRLIIEAIHGVLRTMRSRTSRRVVTSDVNIARVLEAEGIETLFVPTIMLDDSPVDCLRFDPLARDFVGAPLRAFLWELTHVFSTIRLRRETGGCARFDCYWPGKSPSDWTSEQLQIEVKDLSADTDAPDAPVETIKEAAALSTAEPAQAVPSSAGPPAVPAASTTSAAGPGDRAGKTQASAQPGSAGGRTQTPTASRKDRSARPSTIKTVLPRASFPQLLRLLDSARQQRHGSADAITTGLAEEKITVDTARRGLEILRRVRLLTQERDMFTTTADADTVSAALEAGDLDVISSLMERFEPYQAFRNLLREHRQVPREAAGGMVMDLLGGVGSYEAARLPRFHTLLGQAWSLGEMIVDGSQRLTDRDATDVFGEAFAATAAVGIAKVQDLLQHFCAVTCTSPWAAKRQIGKLVAEGMLEGYTFQPAAGGKPITKDEIVSGSLEHLEITPVIIDRLTLGNRPVFTIEGPGR